MEEKADFEVVGQVLRRQILYVTTGIFECKELSIDNRFGVATHVDALYLTGRMFELGGELFDNGALFNKDEATHLAEISLLPAADEVEQRSGEYLEISWRKLVSGGPTGGLGNHSVRHAYAMTHKAKMFHGKSEYSASHLDDHTLDAEGSSDSK